MSSRHANSKELVLAALHGEPTVRPAVGPMAVHFCARVAGASLRDYTLKPRVLAESMLRYYERFRPDAVCLSADTWVTAEAMGRPVAFPGDEQPLAGTPGGYFQSRSEIDRIPAPDPARQGRCPVMLEALARIVEAIGDEACVLACFDQYPFSLACALWGMERLMLAIWDDRPLVDHLLERAAEYTIAYAEALAAAGAHVLTGGDSPAGLIGPKLYREIALPAEVRVIAAIKKRTSLGVALHICGNAEPILADMSRSGADTLEMDQEVDLATACRIVPEHVAIWGNLDPVALLARGTPAEVAAAAAQALATVEAAGRRRYILSSGCTLAVDTPCENVAALVEAARRHGPFPSSPATAAGEHSGENQ